MQKKNRTPKSSAAELASWRSWRRGIVIGAAVVALAGVMICKSQPPTPLAKTVNGLASKPIASTNRPDIYSNYVGSASCLECHPEAYKKWAGSHHAEAERMVQTNRDQVAFDPAREFKHGTQKTFVEWQNGHAFIAGFGVSNRWATNIVARVIGEDPLRQYLIAFPGGRFQVQEASYDPRSNEWFNVYGSEDRMPGEWGHWTGRGMNWNAMCAACHNTRVQKNYDEAKDSYHTTMSEPTVSCEACHGPLKAHVDWQKKYAGTGQKDPVFPKLSREQIFNMCESCHARRADLTGDFVPGEKFDDHYELTTVDASDVFYPDGQNRDEDYETTSFLGSKMQHAGLTCLDCHPRSLHMAKLHGNALCMQCHKGGFPKAPTINPTEHSHHADGNAGNECANCHMPQTIYMQRHSRHDHGFTIPDPLLTKQFGVPNACNRCHADKSVDWSLTNTVAWYGDKMQRHTRDRAQIIARARAGEDSSRTNLTQLLQTEEIPYWRAVAANLLSPWSADRNVTAALLVGLNDTNAMVRSACVRSLAQLVDNETVAKAIEAKLNDPLRNVRVAAAWALRATLDPHSPAAADLKKFLEINADQPTGQMQLGAFEIARGNLTNAADYFQTAVKWDPYSPGIRHELAIVLSQLDRPQEAVAQLEAAVKLQPNEAEYHYKLALALNETGDSARVLSELESAVKCDPRHARAWYNLALVRNGAGDTAGALEAMARAESAEPNDPRIPYARATILAQLGRLNEARNATRRALEIDPNFSAASSLLQQLEAK
ncbi:MAG: tetratricopeptide repeat protein [Verrucomicrobiae bacterium]